jgi:hypothetical protein
MSACEYWDGNMVAKIVLTADETMMSMYQGGMFVGFSTCMPTGIRPDWLYFTLFSLPVPRREGRASYVDLGLRIVEASLFANFTDEEVVGFIWRYGEDGWEARRG